MIIVGDNKHFPEEIARGYFFPLPLPSPLSLPPSFTAGRKVPRDTNNKRNRETNFLQNCEAASFVSAERTYRTETRKCSRESFRYALDTRKKLETDETLAFNDERNQRQICKLRRAKRSAEFDNEETGGVGRGGEREIDILPPAISKYSEQRRSIDRSISLVNALFYVFFSHRENRYP